MRRGRGRLSAGIGAARVAALVLALGLSTGLAADAPGPFEKFAGRWVGEGRLGIRATDNSQINTELVKCRVTYQPSDNGNAVHQAIRCAAQGGSIDVQTDVRNADGTLSGTWKELTRDWAGDVTGTVTDKGLRVRIGSENLSANMNIQLRDQKQVIEIQFINSSLIGLTLLLTRG
jgi:hypothetical protein